MQWRRLASTVGAIFALGSLHLPTSATDNTGKYMVFGPGVSSCGEWTNLRRERSDYGISGWLTGYISAYNSLPNGISNIAQGTDVEGMLAWVDNYCAKNPLDKISTAASALVDELLTRSYGIKTP